MLFPPCDELVRIYLYRSADSYGGKFALGDLLINLRLAHTRNLHNVPHAQTRRFRFQYLDDLHLHRDLWPKIDPVGLFGTRCSHGWTPISKCFLRQITASVNPRFCSSALVERRRFTCSPQYAMNKNPTKVHLTSLVIGLVNRRFPFATYRG